MSPTQHPNLEPPPTLACLADPDTTRSPDGPLVGSSGATARSVPAPSSYDSWPDAALLKAHVDGDRYALSELLRRHRPALWRVARQILGNREDAEDALQEAHTRVFVYAAGYRGEATVSTWLHRITINAAVLARHKRREGDRPLDHRYEALEDPHSAEGLRSIESLSAMSTLLEAIPEQYRAAFALVGYLQYSHEEAADALALPLGTVKSKVWRARRHLWKIFEESRQHGNP